MIQWKLCGRCKETKLTDFFGSDASRKDGLNRLCKPCHRERIKEVRKRHGGHRAARLQDKYRLSVFGYEKLFDHQNGVCWICGDPPPTGKHLEVDHDHESGQVRGLLCGRCNKGLGGFRDRDELLRRASCYLQAHGTYHENTMPENKSNYPAGRLEGTHTPLKRCVACAQLKPELEFRQGRRTCMTCPIPKAA